MAISQALLDILVCPVCKQPVTLRTDPPSLKCSACHRSYPIRDGLPIMLEDQATVEDE
jgi:uncharacterized protein